MSPARRYLDPELAAIVPDLPHFNYEDAAEARRAVRELTAAYGSSTRTERRVIVKDDIAVGKAGSPDVPVRVYSPVGRGDADGGLLFVHGGAFILGDLDSEHARCCRIAAEADCVVVSVDYRLAPEHPFPEGIEDCYQALTWMSENAGALSIDPRRLAVAGVSAGGGLAAGLALMARDRGFLGVAFQLLVYPVLDDRMQTRSMQDFDAVPCWNAVDSRHMWRHYLSGKKDSEVSPYAAPAQADHFNSLPPAYIVTAELDPLRDEGILFAQALLAAGIPTELHQYAGAFHGFDVVAPDAEISERAVMGQIVALRRALRLSTSST